MTKKWFLKLFSVYKFHMTPIFYLKYEMTTISSSFCKKNSKSVSSHSSSIVTLSYDVFHPEKTNISQVPVIILHGFLSSKEDWRDLGQTISVKYKRKVYSLDARNHGESTHVDDIDYSLMAEDVKRFMSSKSIPEALFIGHSMGGRTAMLLAFTNASLVNKLVVVDVSPIKTPKQAQLIPVYLRNMKEALDKVPALSLSQARTYIDGFLSKTIPKDSIRQFLLSNLKEQNNVLSWKLNIDVLLKKFDADIVPFPHKDGVYKGDTLFICGGDSPFVKPDGDHFIQVMFPKSRFVRIPNAGHWVHIEKPSDFLVVVQDILL